MNLKRLGLLFTCLSLTCVLQADCDLNKCTCGDKCDCTDMSHCGCLDKKDAASCPCEKKCEKSCDPNVCLKDKHHHHHHNNHKEKNK